VSKDRTIPGAPATGTAFGGGRAVAANRLPTAPRERKPALAALAVLLILAGALATMILVTKSGQRVSVVRVGNTTIAAGSKLDASQFVETSVAKDNSINYVPWSQVGSLLQGPIVDRIGIGWTTAGTAVLLWLVLGLAAATLPGARRALLLPAPERVAALGGRRESLQGRGRPASCCYQMEGRGLS